MEKLMTNNFFDAVEKTLRFEDEKLEGKITHDTGGRTRFGISQKQYPDETLVYDLPVKKAIERAKLLYYNDYWLPIKGDNFLSSVIAWDVFDSGVNCGIGTSVKMLQHAINRLAKTSLILDGSIGEKTISAANSCDGNMLHDSLNQVQMEHYTHLDEINHEKYGAYLKGWLRRARE